MDQELASKTVESPIGPISLFAIGPAIVRVELNKRTKEFGSAKVLAEAEAQLKKYFLGTLKRFTVKIQSEGTEFQKAVWKEIAKLDSGQHLSYGDIAKAIGKPKAVRGVGAAVGANPTPLIVGCHRVLGSTGKLTGYSGGKGISTKKWLLRHEQIDFAD